MTVRPRRALAVLLALIFACGVPESAVAVAVGGGRDDYANPGFAVPLSAGLRHFYAESFPAAQRDFERALAAAPDNTLALSFRCAAAAQQPEALDALTNEAEDAAARAPKNYVAHIRLGFAYLFESLAGRDRRQDARDEFEAARSLDFDAPAAHVGLGIMRFDERFSNRAKTELLLALRTDPSDVLAREYLGELYQTDLHDAQRGLSYVIDVPNLVPDYADIAFHIGSLLADLRQPAAALAYLERGIALDSHHVGEAGRHGYTLVATILLDQHRVPEATRELETALAAGVDTIYARALLDKIKAGGYASPAPGPTALLR